VCAQNCTVNAGLDNSRCLTFFPLNNFAYDIVTLNGNSAGNISATPNLLWELVSAPTGATVTFSNPNANSTIIKARMIDIPSGNYIFRLGINCLSGERVFDSVTINIKNLCDFVMTADKTWSSLCTNSTDVINFVGSPLRIGEAFKLTGRSIQLVNSNTITALNTEVFGPTADSIRISIRKANTQFCAFDLSPLAQANIRNGDCLKAVFEPTTGPGVQMGSPKASIIKIAPRNRTDTIVCINSNDFGTTASNICIIGGNGNIADVISGLTTIRLAGSGNITGTTFSSTGVRYNINNRWDTVTRNSLHVFEITYAATSCNSSFKDTVSVFFKSIAPPSGILTTNSTNVCLNGAQYPVVSNLKIPLAIASMVPPNCKLVTTQISGPVALTILNPNATDTVIAAGNKPIGSYTFRTTIIDTVGNCTGEFADKIFNYRKKNVLPILRDTVVCPSANTLNIPYPRGSFIPFQHDYILISFPANAVFFPTISTDDSVMTVNYSSSNKPGIYTFKSSATNFPSSCNENISDTFQIEIYSLGFPSNAGTDQRLLCNVSTTNLAGTNLNQAQGFAGFWKFLPAISLNAQTPPNIADTTNSNTLISGFTNLSSNYFSWNLNSGIYTNYCNLKPDTVLVVFSGVPPSALQQAQANYTGVLASNGNYLLTSNAIVPTFNVQWNKISGVGGTLVSPNSQNTSVTGLTIGIYLFELVINNTCGTFKDTVVLNFTSLSGLPVKLLNFAASKYTNEYDKLTWVVTEEVDMKSYEIQTSTDGLNFYTIGNIGLSNSTSTNKFYEFITDLRSEQLYYYRLKMVNLDGSFAYSKIVFVERKKMGLFKFQLSPNPAASQTILSFNSNISKLTTIQIKNASGITVFTKNIQVLKERNTFVINLSSFTKGLYFVKILDTTIKLIVN
jgi:hypothetical protein